MDHVFRKGARALINGQTGGNGTSVRLATFSVTSPGIVLEYLARRLVSCSVRLVMEFGSGVLVPTSASWPGIWPWCAPTIEQVPTDGAFLVDGTGVCRTERIPDPSAGPE